MCLFLAEGHYDFLAQFYGLAFGALQCIRFGQLERRLEVPLELVCHSQRIRIHAFAFPGAVGSCVDVGADVDVVGKRFCLAHDFALISQKGFCAIA